MPGSNHEACIKGLCFGAAHLSGDGDAGAHQRQSAINNLALAAPAVAVRVLDWDQQTEATECLVLLIFLALSAIKHLSSGLREDNRSARSWTRPLGTFAFIVTIASLMWRALAAHP